MADLKIVLLGGLEIGAGRGEAGASLTRKAKALVAYLALSGGQAHSREKLAALLWGDSPEEQARTNLRQTLSTIRKALGQSDAGPLITEGDQVAFDLSGAEVDVPHFERLAMEESAEALEAAVALYKGDLLDGFSLREESFESWTRTERERLRASAIDALAKLIAHYRETRDAERCIRTATRLLALDPLREAAHRALMRAYGAQGRFNSALKQFEICRDTLHRELGVQPEPETLRLFREIREQRAARGAERDDAAIDSVESDARTGTSRTPDEPEPGLALPNKPSVAVLPFENLSGDPDQGYFADGITENIITGLTRFRGLFVIAPKSIFARRDQAADVKEIGRLLGVEHVVEGSIRKAGKRVRVTARLIDAASRHRLWGEKYDRDLSDIFAVQDEITDIIVATLAGRIEDAARHRVANKPAEDMAAYDHLLRGRQYLNRYTEEGEIEARRHFERALELDADYAAAYTGLAVSHQHEYESNWSQAPREALDRAYELAQKAVALDETDSTARYALGHIYHYRNRHELAKAQIDMALTLNPNDYHNLCGKGWILSFAGELDEATHCLNEAIRLNPFAPDNCLFNIALIDYTAGRYEDAIAAFGKVTGWVPLRSAWLAACYAQLGRDEEARAAAAEVLESARTELAIQPENDVERWRGFWARLAHFKNPADFEHLLDGLRKAGLPV